MTAVTAEGERAPATAGPGIEVLRDRPYDGPGGPTLDAYLHRAAKRPRPALLVVHGGAWAADDKRSMAPVAAAAARRGLAVFNVNYTLAQPGSPGFPRQYAELRAAVRWIRANADRLNVDPRRVGALGTSAGGHLVALLAGVGRGPLDRGARIRAAVTWSGPFELGSLGGWLGLAVHNFVGCLAIDCSGRITAASPVAHASPDDPPMLIFNSREELIPADQARSLAERLTDAGVPHRLQLLKGDLHGRAYASVVLRHSVRFIVSHLTP